MSVRMRGFAEYMKLDKAQRIVLSNVRTLGAEALPFQDVLGRVLAENVRSAVDAPPFDRSSVDGYAVKAADTFGASGSSPKKLRLIGAVAIGTKPKVSIKKGTAVKIMTGAPLPKGADASVMVENTRARGKFIEVLSPVTPGKNVGKRGEDIVAGELVFKKGKVIRPQEVGMLALTQNLRVNVFRRPRVAILATGSELRKPGSKLKFGEITDSNSYALSAAVTSQGCVADVLGTVPDDKKKLRQAISSALGDDMVFVSGGASVGELDLVPDTISDMGKVLFHGVALRPGGPTAFGFIRRKPVFSLPGFPVAVLMAFHFLARPALLAMQGLPADYGRRCVRAKLSGDVSSTLGRADVARVKLSVENGKLLAEPVMVLGSGILSSMTRADGLVVVPEDVEGFSKGQDVEVELL